MSTGSLFLIPTFISGSSTTDSIANYNISVALSLNVFIVEEIRSARRFLRSIGYRRDFGEVDFFELNEHTKFEVIKDYLKPLLNGKNLGLISEAGLPCIADPGAELVLLAHQKNIRIVPLTGPNSIILALMASGLNGQTFKFNGYLPIEKNKRTQEIKTLEKDALGTGVTQIFIETPYRNNQLLDVLLSICNPDLRLCIASNINSKDEMIKTMFIREWIKSKPDLHKKPVVFLFNY